MLKKMLAEFKFRKQSLISNFHKVAKETSESAQPMSKEELADQIGL
ncbi:hypothetical protein JOD14_000720 [Enterococcus lemanii]|jgi:hypothetical protein|nr:hypothetical protein [Enterococcus lemanii]